MAVDRKLLQQALLQGQDITNRAISGEGFDPRGGWGVAAAQIATAGIGAYAQNKAKKALAEDLQNRTAAFESKFPQFAGLNLTPESQEAIALKAAGAQIDSQNQTPSFSIRDTAQGTVRVNNITGEASPITLGGQPVQPVKKETTINVGAGEKEFEKITGKGAGDRFNSIIEAGDKSFAADTSLEEVEKALKEGAFVGPGSSKLAALNEVSAAFGLPANLEKAANTRVIQQRIGDLTLQATGKLKGAISEKELALAKATVADIGTSELATTKAISVLKRLNSYDRGLADLATSLKEQNKFISEFPRARREFNAQFRKDLRDLIKSNPKEQEMDQNKQPQPQPQPQGQIKFLGFE